MNAFKDRLEMIKVNGPAPPRASREVLDNLDDLDAV